MWKYWAIMFVALLSVLAYTYLADPCNRLLRADFALRHPGDEIIDTGAEKGSPESVHCHVSYRKPGEQSRYEEVWLYQYEGTRWEFARVVEPSNRRPPP
jgi:hypothetical protein